MLGISDSYRKLEAAEVPAIAHELENAWQDPSIPRRQWIGVVRGEMERLRAGQWLPHFEILIRAVKLTGLATPSLLDVGASSGFYSEILKLGGVSCRYTALDYSSEYMRLAGELYPGIDFHLGDARDLPFADGAVEIVLSGCCLIHIYEAEKVIAESARVASKFVIMNRTPVMMGVPTTYFEKRAYGVRTLEIHYNESDLFAMFAKHALEVVSSEDVYTDPENLYAHRTYLLRKNC
jgi:SAM-dependent methyltransferase